MAGVRFAGGAADEDDVLVGWDTVDEQYEYTMAVGTLRTVRTVRT
jgi:hypothetical protein